MRAFLKRVLAPIIQFVFKRYYKKSRKFRFENLEVLVAPEVFPPHFTVSTKILLNYIKELDLKGKTFLELGCGSGIISLFAASRGALVTATDINQIALTSLEKAKIKNGLDVSIVYSDLFENISENRFDVIFINPPYYPRKPKNDQEKAWFCGEEFEYFEKLFLQFSKRNLAEEIYMILSEDCEIKKIKSLAEKNKLVITSVLEKTKLKEINYIFKIIKNDKKY